MWQNYWDVLAAAPAQALFTLVIFCVVWTRVGSLVMKYFAPQVPVLNHAAILFWATFRVQIAVLALIFLAGIFGISLRPLSAVFGVLVPCAVGWLVTQHLSRSYGVPTKFPAVGAKVATTMVVITWLIVIAVIVITKA